jgi:dTDP-glucose 4,6-dehydratase
LIADRSISFVKGDIRDTPLIRRLFEAHGFTRVAHLAAASYVDRSIDDPEAFLQTNVLGTFSLLKTALDVWRAIGAIEHARFLHVSTDEVYGSLGPGDPAFTESSSYRWNSPYAASNHLVRAFVETYRMPALITNCSNNYGPFQHPEKLIPLMIIHALEGKPLPVYGDGSNIRDWLHVSDHCQCLMRVMENGRIEETYNIGGGNERNNRDVVGLICDVIDRAFAADAALKARFPSCPAASAGSCRALISFVADRPGHDQRYGDRCRQARRPALRRGVRERARTNRALVSRSRRLVARRHDRRQSGLDRQELRRSSCGLDEAQELVLACCRALAFRTSRTKPSANDLTRASTFGSRSRTTKAPLSVQTFAKCCAKASASSTPK